MNLNRILTIFAAAILVGLAGCSDSTSTGQEDSEGSIEQATEKAAKAAVDYIKIPIEQAQHAQQAQEAHNRQLQENIDNQ